ncbi:MAG: hypothetical protein RR367_05370 [Clostridia bacterium]
MKRLLMVTLAFCLLCTGALADTAYSVLPAKIDENALLQLAFGARASQAAREMRDDGEAFFTLDTSGPSFCGYTVGAIQTAFSLCGSAMESGPSEYIGSENVWPTGIAECALTREAAQTQAAAMLETLDLGEYALQAVTAYGRVPGYRDEYQLAFLQRLNGRAAYWSCSIQPADDNMASVGSPIQRRPQTNRVEVTLDEQGLLRLNGAWCRYEATGDEITPMEEVQAVAAFAELGITVEKPERCYYLQYDGNAAMAIPAWRALNSFLHAETGKQLQ